MKHIALSDIITMHAALSDPLRVRMMRLLLERELCVCELERILNEPQYKVSRHLNILKRAGFVTDWREGTWMHYQLSPTLPMAWRTALYALCHVWDESHEVAADRRQLDMLSLRQPGEPLTCER